MQPDIYCVLNKTYIDDKINERELIFICHMADIAL